MDFRCGLRHRGKDRHSTGKLCRSPDCRRGRLRQFAANRAGFDLLRPVRYSLWPGKRRVAPARNSSITSTSMGRTERTREIARRRARREKLKKLRQRFANAKSEAEKADLRAKVARVSPFAPLG